MEGLLCALSWDSMADTTDVTPAFMDLTFGIVGRWGIRQQGHGRFQIPMREVTEQGNI